VPGNIGVRQHGARGRSSEATCRAADTDAPAVERFRYALSGRLDHSAVNPGACSTALALSQAEIPVFPCRAETKGPATRHGFKDASRDCDAICKWFAREDRLVGVPTGPLSGFNALDIDPRHGGDKWLAENRPKLPVTRVHTTRSGGQHWLFHHHPGVRNSESRVAPGVDVRGDGGYIIWWPAVGLPLIVDAPITDWPAWLLPALLPSPQPAAAIPRVALPPVVARNRAFRLLERMLLKLANAPAGQRHYRLRAAACVFGELIDAIGMDEASAAQMLFAAAKQAGGPEVSDRNALRTIAWGIAKGRQPQSASTSG
jgi:hypothetical protein